MEPSAPDETDPAVDTEGKTLPPYEGRHESAEVHSGDESTRDGAHVGGATGPVEVEPSDG